MRMALTIMLSIIAVVGFIQTAATGADNGAKETDSNAALLKALHVNGGVTDAQFEALKNQMEKEKKENALTAFWQNGTRFKSADGAFDIKIGGRILNDWAVIDADNKIEDAFGDTLVEGSGTEMRHARLSISGLMYHYITFKAEYDFAGSDADFKDVWLGMKDLPAVGEVRVGHQKEPFSLEALNNVMYLVFMEPAATYAFAPVRNTGIKIHNSAMDKRLGWAVGAYKNVDDTGDGFTDESDYNITGRISFLPWNEDRGRRLFHLGFSYSHQFRDGGTVRFRERPESHITDARLVDTGNIGDVDGVNLMNPEAAFVYGSLCLQSEFVQVQVDSEAADDPDFAGFYLFASYFLTGENRQYRQDDGGGEFTRVKIKDDFSLKNSGWGAWEVALRYSRIDLNDGNIQGGEKQSWSAALSWYLNPNVRWSFNYIKANVEERDVDGTYIDDANVDILMSRFQIYF